jgi:hypothetical protein
MLIDISPMLEKDVVICYVELINEDLLLGMFHGLVLFHNSCEHNLPYAVPGVKEEGWKRAVVGEMRNP